MREVAQLFEKALGLTTPWKVERSEFDADRKQLDLFLDFERGARFACPSCSGEDCPVHDTEDKQWRHLNFFQYRAYLHARVPRVRCPRCGVRQVEPPWARPGSGFTHLFEAFVMTLAAEMPVRAIADILSEHDTRIWRLVHFHIDRARAAEDFSGVRHLGVDETSHHVPSTPLTQLCGAGRTAALLFAMPVLGSTELLAWGLASEASPPRGIDARARTLAVEIASLPESAVRGTKANLRLLMRRTIHPSDLRAAQVPRRKAAKSAERREALVDARRRLERTGRRRP